MLDILALLFTLALLGIITAYYLDQASDPFNNFFNSNTFGPRITLSLSATLLDAHWKNVEREVRVLDSLAPHGTYTTPSTLGQSANVNPRRPERHPHPLLSPRTPPPESLSMPTLLLPRS